MTVSKLSKRIKISWMLALLVAFASIGFMSQQNTSANHPVLVEGEQDFDGDGRRGVDEDNDNNTDRIFGTISQALLGVNGGANANGLVLIVTSGRFPELIRIPNTAGGQATLNGVTILEAAPGVAADIDAVLQGDANNAARQAAPGIVITTDQTDRLVILRNLIVRNFTEGIQVSGTARVQIINVRLDDNLNFGIRAMDSSRVTVIDSFVNATGQRFNPTAGTPGPGTGIRFEGTSTGTLIRTVVSGNTAAGVSNASTRPVLLSQSSIFDNGSNLSSTAITEAFKTVSPEDIHIDQ